MSLLYAFEFKFGRLDFKLYSKIGRIHNKIICLDPQLKGSEYNEKLCHEFKQLMSEVERSYDNDNRYKQFKNDFINKYCT